MSAFYGEPGSGKSVLAEDIGLHVAAGLAVVRPRGEAIARCCMSRWNAPPSSPAARSRSASSTTWSPSGCRSGWCAGRSISAIPTSPPRSSRSLTDLARRYRCDAGLVIVDTVSRALCGGDENSPKDMGALIANLGRIQGDADIHLLLTHHQPAEKERMRGHGALLGAVDTTVHVTKTTAGRLAEVVKSQRP